MAAPIQADLTGKTALVTGATGGIGREIARGLAKLGASVIVGARDRSKGEAVVSELSADAKVPGSVSLLVIDVSSIASVRAAAAELGERHAKLDILVNNAGAWFTDRRETGEGHELTLATNVIGPYLLTKLLAPRIPSGGRVVNVVSELAANYDATDLEWKQRPFDGFKVYAQSKQALRMVTWLHAEQLKSKGIDVNAAAPGFVKTDFNQNAKGFMAAMIGFMSRFMAVSPAEGADTPIWVAAASELAGKSARYFDKRTDKDGKFRDQAALAELDRLLDEMTRDRRAPSASASA